MNATSQNISENQEETKTTVKRNIVLDIYKGMLIILVISRHVLQFSTSDEGGLLSNIIWGVQMPGFIILSGYLSFRKLESLRSVRERITNCFIHYAIPFFSWFVIVSVLLLGNYNRNIISAFKDLMFHADAGLWFLWTIFVLSCVVSCCNYILTKTKIIFSVLFWTLCVLFLYLVSRLLGRGFLGINFIVHYSVYYILGWLLRYSEAKWKMLWDRIKEYLVFISLAIFVGIALNIDIIHDGNIIVRYIAGITGNVVLLWVCNKYRESLMRCKLNVIGTYTLEIYATHVVFVRLMSGNVLSSLYSVSGFFCALVSFLLVCGLTFISIVVLRSNSLTNLIFYGKKIVRTR